MLEAGTWELTLFEKNPHFGGTWYENTYVSYGDQNHKTENN
jgi:cation diffusion facilitator CzcD-associated flavoprotein CzcO